MKVRRIDFYPDDWLEGTLELDGIAIGVYITLCSLIYARGGPITIDLLKHACRNDHGNAVVAAVNRLEKARKIVRNGLEITQKRCENELERARKRLTNASENARKRWDVPSDDNDIADAPASDAAYANGNAHARDNQQPSSINDGQKNARSRRGRPRRSLPSSSEAKQAPACKLCGTPPPDARRVQSRPSIPNSRYPSTGLNTNARHAQTSPPTSHTARNTQNPAPRLDPNVRH